MLTLAQGIGLWCIAAVALWPAHTFAQDTIKIGHVGPLSGASAHLGKYSENGVRMAIDELNAKGGVSVGGKAFRVELMPADDGGAPAQAVAAAQSLCDSKVNGVVGHLDSGTTLPAARVYAGCEIPHITPGAAHPQVTQQGFRTTFRIVAGDAHIGAALGQKAKSLGVSKAAIISRSDRSRAVSNAFKAAGIDIVDQKSFSDGQRDYLSIIAGFQRRSDTVLVDGRFPERDQLVELLAREGYGRKAILLSSCEGRLDEIETVICAEPGPPIEVTSEGREWSRRYDQKFRQPPQHYAPHAYDAVFVLIDAMQRARSTDPRVYGPKLRETDYKGVTGKIQFQENGDRKNPSVTVYTNRRGSKTSDIVLTSTSPTPSCPGTQCYCTKHKECRDNCDTGC